MGSIESITNWVGRKAPSMYDYIQNHYFVASLILAILYWVLLFLILFPLRVDTSISAKTSVLEEKAFYMIFLNNLFVAMLLSVGVFSFGITTLITSASNALFIFCFVFPNIIDYGNKMPSVWLFSSFEIGAYILSTAFGFLGILNQFIKLKNFFYDIKKSFIQLFPIIVLLLIIASVMENSFLHEYNNRILS